MTTIFLVEDHPIMMAGYQSLIRLEDDLEVCGLATSAEEAFSQIEDLQPDVVVLDLQLPGANGIEFVKRLKSLGTDVRILVVSAHDEALYGERSMKAGAHGYLMKDNSSERFIDAIRDVSAGELYVSGGLRDTLVEGVLSRRTGSSSPVSSLSDRELEVFELIGRGLTTQQMADTMILSPKTIESHRANIKTKLGADTLPELIRRAVVWVEPLDGQA
ncbi:response regulator [Rubrivirga sp.]|uniref:response regulator transcription factor n=1 Tax=Rubrivirga sp. TaxID=1885344 RepID=UPI003C796DC5